MVLTCCVGQVSITKQVNINHNNYSIILFIIIITYYTSTANFTVVI